MISVDVKFGLSHCGRNSLREFKNSLLRKVFGRKMEGKSNGRLEKTAQ